MKSNRLILLLCVIIIFHCTGCLSLLIQDMIRNKDDPLEGIANTPQEHNRIGIALEHQGRLDEAAKHYRIAVELKPDFFEAYANLGNIYYRQRKLKDAAKFYQRALQINDSYAPALNNLAMIYIERSHNLQEALDMAQRAVDQKPDDIHLYLDTLARAYYSLGWLNTARQMLLKAKEMAPQDNESFRMATDKLLEEIDQTLKENR